MRTLWDADAEPYGLPEPGSPEFVAGLASDEFAEAWRHLHALCDLDHEAAEVVAQGWRRALDAVVGG
ncbi:MAG: hypothetical protein ACRDZO_16720 [Egibacteraceae bacterium]